MSERLPTVTIKGSEYTLVKERILHFNATYEYGMIQTELVSAPDSNRIVIKATVTPDAMKMAHRYFVDYAQELVGDGMVNKTSALENASTSAIGRALALMGIGVIESTGTGIASADEVYKAQGALANKDLNKPTIEQKQQIIALCRQLGIKSPTADDSEEWSDYCQGIIGSPQPLNQDQAKKIIARMHEDILDLEQKRLEARDE